MFNNGFWVHNLTQNAAGQPADVIAVKDNKAYLIDCKVCSQDRFPLSRIESNQDTSMALWEDCNNDYGLFALQMSTGQIFMIPRAILKALSCEMPAANFETIIKYGVDIDTWLDRMNKLCE